MADKIKKFKTGETYSTRSICDHNCIFSFKIERRTAKNVWVSVHGDIVRRAIKTWEGTEEFKPFGTYSMCPVVSAS